MNNVSPPDWTYERLEQLIRDQAEENLQLEFKGPAAASSADKISKSVSSMANSAGGTVIFGIQEGPVTRESPQRALVLDPINPKEVSKERFESLVTGNIHPRLPEFVITPVSTPDSKGVFYVVEVSQSHTIHQARGHKYYRRRNFTTEAMEDYEIREGMQRCIHPLVSVKSNIVVSPRYLSLHTEISNVGQKLIKQYALTIESKAANGMSCGGWTWTPENKYMQAVSGLPTGNWQAVLPIKGVTEKPIFPGQTIDLEMVFLQSRQLVENRYSSLKFRFYADEMPYKELKTTTRDLCASILEYL